MNTETDSLAGVIDEVNHSFFYRRPLETNRTGDGRWNRLPFHYTLIALSETSIDLALDEMRYAAPVLERSMKRPQHKTDIPSEGS